MGSSLHLPGVGLRPGLVGRRTLGAILERDRQRTADTRWAQMVRSIGNGLHIVKDFCNDAEYVVGSAQGSLSYRPGQVVALMSSTGTPGEVIVAQPPPGRAGASAFPVALSTRSTRFAVTAPSSCPILSTGKSYLAIQLETLGGGAWRLNAWRYTDGTYQSTIGTLESVDVPGLSTPAFTEFQRIHSLGDTVVFSVGSKIVTWNTASGTAQVLETNTIHGGPVWPGSGSDVYFQWSTNDPDPPKLATLQLCRAAIGATGVLDLEAARVGNVFEDDENFLSAPTILCASGSDFQVQSYWFDPEGPDNQVIVPYFVASGVDWNMGFGRQVVGVVYSNGYATASGHSVRVCGQTAEHIGLLPPGPSTPEIDLLPSDWTTIIGCGFPSVSPTETEVATYPFELVDDEPEPLYLFRCHLQTQRFPDGCGIPRIPVEVGPNGFRPGRMLCRD